jgi:hypothetical protein
VLQKKLLIDYNKINPVNSTKIRNIYNKNTTYFVATKNKANQQFFIQIDLQQKIIYCFYKNYN